MLIAMYARTLLYICIQYNKSHIYKRVMGEVRRTWKVWQKAYYDFSVNWKTWHLRGPGSGSPCLCQLIWQTTVDWSSNSNSTYQWCPGSLRWKYRKHMSTTGLIPSNLREKKIVLHKCSDQQFPAPDLSYSNPRLGTITLKAKTRDLSYTSFFTISFQSD